MSKHDESKDKLNLASRLPRATKAEEELAGIKGAATHLARLREKYARKPIESIRTCRSGHVITVKNEKKKDCKTCFDEKATSLLLAHKAVAAISTYETSLGIPTIHKTDQDKGDDAKQKDMDDMDFACRVVQVVANEVLDLKMFGGAEKKIQEERIAQLIEVNKRNASHWIPSLETNYSFDVATGIPHTVYGHLAIMLLEHPTEDQETAFGNMFWALMAVGDQLAVFLKQARSRMRAVKAYRVQRHEVSGGVWRYVRDLADMMKKETAGELRETVAWLVAQERRKRGRHQASSDNKEATSKAHTTQIIVEHIEFIGHSLRNYEQCAKIIASNPWLQTNIPPKAYKDPKKALDESTRQLEEAQKNYDAALRFDRKLKKTIRLLKKKCRKVKQGPEAACQAES